MIFSKAPCGCIGIQTDVAHRWLIFKPCDSSSGWLPESGLYCQVRTDIKEPSERQPALTLTADEEADLIRELDSIIRDGDRFRSIKVLLK